MATLRERLRAILGLDTSDFEKGLDRSGKKVKGFNQTAQRGFAASFSQLTGMGRAFIGGLGAGLVGAALTEIGSNIRRTIGDVADLADEAGRIGVTTDEIQGLQHGFKLAGVEQSSFTSGLEKFVDNIGQAAQGAGALKGILAAHNVELKNADGSIRSTSELLREFADIVNNTADPAAKMALVTDAFGRGGKAMVGAFEGGSAALDAMVVDAKAAGYVIDAELVQKAAVLDDKFDNLTQRAGVFFKSLVVGTADFFTEWESGEARLGKGVAGDLGMDAAKVGASVEDLGKSYLDIEDAAYSAQEAVRQLASELMFAGESAEGARLGALVADMNELNILFNKGEISAADYTTSMNGISVAAEIVIARLGEVDGVSMDGAISAIGGLSSAIAQAVGLAGRLAASMQVGNMPKLRGPAGASVQTAASHGTPGFESGRMGSGSAPYVDPGRTLDELIAGSSGSGTGGAGGGGRSGFNSRIQSIKDETAALEAEAAAFLAALHSGKEYGIVLEFARKKAALLAEAQKAGKEITPELTAEIDALAEAYATAAENAEAAEDKLKALEEAADAGKDALVGMFTSILNGSKSGKEALGGLLMMIAEAQLRAALLGAMGNGGFLGFVGQLLNVGANANGTTNWQGGLTMVGERGAELVGLPRGAQVFSNLDSRRMLDEGGPSGRIEIVPSPYFDAVVDERADARVSKAAPGIVGQSVQATGAAMRKTKRFGN